MSPIEEIPQADSLRLQLAMIRGHANPPSLFEIRFRVATGGMKQIFVSVADLARAGRVIGNAARTRDVFVGAAPRERESGTAAAVESVFCLWADCDSPEAVAALRAFRPLPSIVIRSGTDRNVHAWWPLHQAVSPSQAVRANRRLALALGADAACTDVARMLRPAGTSNFKHDPPRPVECVRLELDTFDAGQVVGGLADDPRYTQRPARPAARVQDADSVLCGLARVVREAVVGERNVKLNWAAYRAGEHATEGTLDADQARTQLLAAAIDAGLSEPEAIRTIGSGLAATERQAA